MIIQTDVIDSGERHVQIVWEFSSPMGRYRSPRFACNAGRHVKMQVLRTAVEFRRMVAWAVEENRSE